MKKYVLIILVGFILILSILIFVLSQKLNQDRLVNNNQSISSCTTTIASTDERYKVSIADQLSWNKFIAALGGICSNGTYATYNVETLNPTGTKSLAFIFVKDTQSHSVKATDQTLFTYSQSTSSDSGTVIINVSIPQTTDEDNTRKEKVNSAIFILGYKLFNGKNYTTVDPKLAIYKSLEDLGLTYAEN